MWHDKKHTQSTLSLHYRTLCTHDNEKSSFNSNFLSLSEYYPAFQLQDMLSFNLHFERTSTDISLKRLWLFEKKVMCINLAHLILQITERKFNQSKTKNELWRILYYCNNHRSNHRRCSVKKGALKNFAKFIGKPFWQNISGRLLL